jgi:hypothetical protein
LSASINGAICAGGWLMSPASSDASMLAVADPAPLRPTLLAVDSCTRKHANFLVPGQIVSGLVEHMFLGRVRASAYSAILEDS